ncbi:MULTISPECIES: phosphate-starvation-inducible protein PsiE [Brevibacillus]|uniref:phosphate-starvation-inducible protein PsiE n=1 Tax=Brevibacillus TaxID=55080 RepID=UPI000271884D|nr:MULTISPECIES: phosphate-starvation-inducible protein PsiE [Brevibacillus]EJL41240.1 putative membrane protein [Brevibacillus sp. CF112]ELK40847.1 phosphate starvation-induced protein E [Brevibacillus agri BAB-2500]MDN4091895.1 phosphate-starvation-inducible protein PsiE [Brevibacillus agri]MDR9503092.1 phosphate-starvation-inducible protein PsiE [Brevibacillus agri]
MTKSNNELTIVRFYQLMLNTSLIILGLVLSFYLVRELYAIVLDALQGNNNVHDILEKVLAFFLYFVFVSMIVKYFHEAYHFPLRYLIYIGITGTVRFIIVNRDDAMNNLILSLVIFILVISYIMLAPRQNKVGELKENIE